MEFGLGLLNIICEWALSVFYTHTKKSGLSPRSSAAGAKSWARIEALDGKERRAASFHKYPFRWSVHKLLH